MAGGVSSGIRRKVDDLGRVVIPAGIRRTLNIREGDSVEVSVEGERVVLAKPRDACVFCGREGDDLHRFRSRLVCRECVVGIGEVDRAATPESMVPANGPTPTPPGPPAAPVSPARRPVAPAAPMDAAPPVAPASWPTGPIDGDEFAREQARQRAAAARDGDEHDGDEPDGDEPDAKDARRRPPYDPASTTAW